VDPARPHRRVPPPPASHTTFVCDRMFCKRSARTPLLERFWFPKSLESWLRLSLVYCNTKEKPLQTSPSPINLIYRTLYYFWQWQLINYWDDCHLELIPRPSSATEMNFQSVFECENAWSGRAGARNRIRKQRFSGTKLLNLESVRDCLSGACEGEYLKESHTQQILSEIGCFLLVHRSA
jgi:hypothetical protein